MTTYKITFYNATIEQSFYTDDYYKAKALVEALNAVDHLNGKKWFIEIY